MEQFLTLWLLGHRPAPPTASTVALELVSSTPGFAMVMLTVVMAVMSWDVPQVQLVYLWSLFSKALTDLYHSCRPPEMVPKGTFHANYSNIRNCRSMMSLCLHLTCIQCLYIFFLPFFLGCAVNASVTQSPVSTQAPSSHGRCSQGQFRCRHLHHCIPDWQRCDGRIHCQDTSDEAHCRESLCTAESDATITHTINKRGG